MLYRFGFLLLATCPTGAMAGETADADEAILVVGRTAQPLTLPSETGSRLGLTPLEIPASVYTVDGDAIRARGDLTVVEAASRAPGITPNANPGNANFSLGARGFTGSGSVLLLVDGIRQFPNNGSLSFPTDPWMVDRIDVLTGPASVLYGQGALGGAINVITRKPTRDLHADGELSYGAQDTLHAAAGIGGPLGDRLSYRVDASYRRSDGWVDRGDSDSLALGGVLRFDATDAFTLSLRLDYSDQSPMTYFGTPLIDGMVDKRIRRRNYNVDDADIRFRDDRQSLNAEWRIADGLTFNNAAYRIGSRRRWYNLEDYAALPNGRIARESNLGIGHAIEQIGDQGTLKLSTPIGGQAANDLVIGFDVNRIALKYSHNFDFADQADTVDPFAFDPGTFQNRAETIPRYRTRTTEWSLFFEDRLKLTDRLSIIGGARYEEDRYRRRNILYGPNAGDVSEVNALPGGARRKRFSDLTWRAGAVYRVTPGISLFGQYATGVDPVGTLTTFTTSAAQFAFTNARGDQVEAGVKAAFLNGRGSATLSAYRIVKNDLVAQRTTNGPLEQIGRQSTRGIEAAVSLPLPAGFGVEANGTILDADYDRFVSGNVDFSGNTPQNVPERAGNLWLTWTGGALRAQAGLRYVGKRQLNNANTQAAPAYTVVDGGVSYAFSERLAVDVRVYNLFDRIYASSTYGPEQWLLGRPRSLDVALRTRF